MNIISLQKQGIEASKKALKKFLEDWNKNTGGNKYGEPMYCGFAGVVIFDYDQTLKLENNLRTWF